LHPLEIIGCKSWRQYISKQHKANIDWIHTVLPSASFLVTNCPDLFFVALLSVGYPQEVAPPIHVMHRNWLFSTKLKGGGSKYLIVKPIKTNARLGQMAAFAPSTQEFPTRSVETKVDAAAR
jgi:hypothetical protein